MGGFDKFYKKSLPDAALAFVGVTVANLLAKPTIRSTIRALVRRIVTGSREKLPYKEIPRIEYYADNIMKILDDKEITPKRICIDGMPGSGKSSLGRGLAKRTSLKWRTLYVKELNEDYPFKDG